VESRDHLSPRKASTPHQGVNVESHQQGEEQEQPPGVSGKGPLGQGEMSDIGDFIGGGARALRTFLVKTARKASEPGVPQDLLNAGDAQYLSFGLLEVIVDIVDGEIALAKRNNAFTDRILAGLCLGTVRNILEERAVPVVAELPTKAAEGAVLIAEPLCRFRGGDSLQKKGP